MSGGNVRTVKQQVFAQGKRPIARLVIRDVEFQVPSPWHQDVSLMTPLLKSLEIFGSEGMSISVKEVRASRPTIVESWSAVGVALRSAGSGLFEVRSEQSNTAFSIIIKLTDISITIEVEIPLLEGDLEVAQKLLTMLLDSVHNKYCRKALLGPSLSITLRNVPYVRPRPQREHPHWPAGAVTLAACRRYCESKGPEKLARFEMIQMRDLPSGLIRRSSGDLLVVETKSTDLAQVAEQRTVLEKWIGDALELPIDEDFNERGDRRLMVWDREKAGSLGFYDSTAKVLYKSAPELENNELDPETLDLLKTILETEELPDGRPIMGKRVVFVERPAALRWLSWVKERGGTVAYLGKDGDLWEPALESKG